MSSTSTYDGTCELDQLMTIINSSVEDIKKAYAAAGQAVPSLSKPFVPNEVEQSPDVVARTVIVVAAACQLILTLRPPAQIAIEEALSGPMRSAALGTVVQLHIPEKLREAGPKGANAQELCSGTTANPKRLERLLRLLASRHIFQEVQPGIFGHNRISSVLDTGKSVTDITVNPIDKFESSPGVSALVELYGTHALQAAAMIPDFVTDPSGSVSGDHAHAPISRALGFKGTVWDFYGKPENAAYQARFNAAMTQVGRLYPPRDIIDGFPWADLAPDSLVVDVGGGVGVAVLNLMREHPKLRYIVQDLAPTISDARKYWNYNSPEAVTCGRVQLIEHSFFEPQPIYGASVYILRHIMHDWPIDPSRAILTQLARAAKPESRIVIMELIVPYTSSNMGEGDTSATMRFRAPSPLLPSAGYEFAFDMDIHMMEVVNGQERTVADFHELVEGTGLKIDCIYPGALPSTPSKIVLALMAES